MSKIFNTTADCKPKLHYMVDISSRLASIKGYVDRGEYFTINRARQYGKTTTLRALSRYLADEYYVISMDFQVQMSYAKFRSENAFSEAFAKAFIRMMQQLDTTVTEELEQAVGNLKSAVQGSEEKLELVELFQYLSEICGASDKPLVLMIDEVDSAADYQVFLDFLAQLRGYYIDRDRSATFQSVILAGVYDIKNLKRKVRAEESHKMNSPWNIAADFKVSMSFSAKEISGMLDEYEKEHAIGMSTAEMAKLIYDYTSGYPFLVSRICKLIDETIAESEEFTGIKSAWSKEGVLAAIRRLLMERNSLFESLAGKLDDFPELERMLYTLLFTGKDILFNADNQSITIAAMLGFVKNKGGNVAVANRIFEMRLYNRFLSVEEMRESEIYRASVYDKNQFVINGHLNMRLILEKFVEHFHDLYADSEQKFIEESGRKLFLLYLRPIINGTGNYYIESRTRSMGRTDVIVDYRGEQYITEMKIWRGQEYNNRGEKQLIGYLEDYHQKTGYMLSFCFNKNKQVGIHEIVAGDKRLIEAIV